MSKRRSVRDLAKRNSGKRVGLRAKVSIVEDEGIGSGAIHPSCHDCHMLDYLGFNAEVCSDDELDLVNECCQCAFIDDVAGFLEAYADPMDLIASMVYLGEDRLAEIALPNGGMISIAYRPPEAPTCACTGARGPVPDKEADP